MVYFKDAPLTPSKIDLAQLAAVKAFRDKLGKEGVLFWAVSTMDSFKAAVRLHLSRAVQDWLTQNPAVPAERDIVAKSAPKQLSLVESEDEEGFIDLIETASNAVTTLTEISIRMVAATTTLAEKTTQRAAELNALNASGVFDSHAIKRVMARSAENLEEFVARTSAENPLFIEALRTFLDAFSRAASVSLDFKHGDPSHLKADADNVELFRAKVCEARSSLKGLRDSVAASPRMTTVYNKAKRRAVSAIDATLANLAEADDACGHALEAIQALIHAQARTMPDSTA